MRLKTIATALIVLGMFVTTTAKAALYWTPWVSEENGGPWTACTYWNEAAVGFGCSGGYCDNVRMLCETMINGMTMQPESDTHTPWFSEEGDHRGTCSFSAVVPPAVCIDYGCPMVPGVVSGMHCSGSNCDNLMLECDKVVKYSGSLAYPATTDLCFTSTPFSEEQGTVDFGANNYITAVSCTGKYCDNKTFTVCHFTAPF